MRANIYLNYLPYKKTCRLRAIKLTIINILIIKEVLAGCGRKILDKVYCAP
jgi:hypothetical protein